MSVRRSSTAASARRGLLGNANKKLLHRLPSHVGTSLGFGEVGGQQVGFRRLGATSRVRQRACQGREELKSVGGVSGCQAQRPAEQSRSTIERQRLLRLRSRHDRQLTRSLDRARGFVVPRQHLGIGSAVFL